MTVHLGTEPSEHAWNAYVTWAINAVAGLNIQADAVARTYGDEIEQTAAWLRRIAPPKLQPLYRGVVLSRGEKHDVVRPGWSFVSFSEDRDVALWFAEPRSIISCVVSVCVTDPVGWLIELPEPRLDDVLFHWSWRTLPVPGCEGSRLPWAPLELLAALNVEHSEIAREVEWSLSTQREVMLRPGASYELRVPPAERPSVDVLDRRFAPPWILHHNPWQLAVLASAERAP